MRLPERRGANVLVREYRSQVAFQFDADRLAAEGWRIQTVGEMTQRPGCLRGCLLGFFALVWRPKPRILVTYSRT